MSTAHAVPETWELSGDDAVETLRRTGRLQLLHDAAARLRRSDGFSHARSLALVVSLLIVEGVIGVVGLAAAFGGGDVSEAIVRTLRTALPGPAGELLTDAVGSAHRAGLAHRYGALVLGLVGAIAAGTTAMGQLERGLNRIYGIERDRGFVRKYGLGLVLTLSVGMLTVSAFLAVAVSRAILAPAGDTATSVWAIVRWPVGLVLITVALGLLFRWCPNRRQPAWSWLSFGSAVGALGWFLVTVLLGAVFRLNESFGDTYGPLAGMLALLIWAFLSSLCALFGAAVAAQLEAVRAGAPQPERRAEQPEARRGVRAPARVAGA